MLNTSENSGVCSSIPLIEIKIIYCHKILFYMIPPIGIHNDTSKTQMKEYVEQYFFKMTSTDDS